MTTANDQRDAAQAINQGVDPGRFAVMFTDDSPSKLILPPIPARTATAAQCAWIGGVWQFDPQHPCTGAAFQGDVGENGTVVVQRAGTEDLFLEPAGAIGSARRLLSMLQWRLLPTDGEPYGFKDEHARKIAYVLRMLCGTSQAVSEREQTALVLSTFLGWAVAVEGFTIYGTTLERYEAACKLRSDPGAPPSYLIDSKTGELVIRVGDLQASARRTRGSGLSHTWLNAHMDAIGWTRFQLDGRAESGRAGRSGRHAKPFAYRGFPPDAPDEPDGAVTT